MLTRKRYNINRLINDALTKRLLVFCQLGGITVVEFEDLKQFCLVKGYEVIPVKNTIFNKITATKISFGSEIIISTDTMENLLVLDTFLAGLQKKGVSLLFFLCYGHFFYPSQVAELLNRHLNFLCPSSVSMSVFVLVRFVVLFKYLYMIKVKNGNIITS